MNGVSDEDLIEYCSVLATSADELKVGGLNALHVANVREGYESFRSDVISLATRLSLRTSGINFELSVAIARSTRHKIFAQIDCLQELVDDSGFPYSQKKELAQKLDELRSLVQSPRADFGKMMAALAFVAMATAGVTSFLADAPAAVATITALIGKEKAAEEMERHLLETEKETLKIEDQRASQDPEDGSPF
tara:strand:- start:4707 stop:5285 length:579 start_codon:yes stop_codon:yes gene_type:complete